MLRDTWVMMSRKERTQKPACYFQVIISNSNYDTSVESIIILTIGSLLFRAGVWTYGQSSPVHTRTWWQCYVQVASILSHCWWGQILLSNHQSLSWSTIAFIRLSCLPIVGKEKRACMRNQARNNSFPRPVKNARRNGEFHLQTEQ